MICSPPHFSRDTIKAMHGSLDPAPPAPKASQLGWAWSRGPGKRRLLAAWAALAQVEMPRVLLPLPKLLTLQPVGLILPRAQSRISTTARAAATMRRALGLELQLCSLLTRRARASSTPFWASVCSSVKWQDKPIPCLLHAIVGGQSKRRRKIYFINCWVSFS